MPLVFGLIALAAIAFAMRAKYPAGEGPRDAMPVGFTGAPTSVDPSLRSSSSGRVYTVESWAPNGANETFHVVFPAGRSDAYVSYVANRSSGARKLFRSFGTPTDVAAMRQDFKL